MENGIKINEEDKMKVIVGEEKGYKEHLSYSLKKCLFISRTAEIETQMLLSRATTDEERTFLEERIKVIQEEIKTIKRYMLLENRGGKSL